MKYFVLLTGLILACYLLGFIKKSEKYQWMDRNYTTAIKGFSILTVVWAHSGAIVKPSIISVLAFVVVTYIFAYILYIGMRKVKNDRFNGSYTNKK